MQPHIRDHIRLIPLVGMEPAFGHHALRGEIDHVIRLEIADGGGEFVGVLVQIELLELELPARRPLGWPLGRGGKRS